MLFRSYVGEWYIGIVIIIASIVVVIIIDVKASPKQWVLYMKRCGTPLPQ